MLRITIQEAADKISMTLEGRIAGPWLDELNRTWTEMAPRVGQRKLAIDLHNVTYSDPGGKEVLREIYAETHAEFITGSPWTEYLAQEIKLNNRIDEESPNGNA